MPRVDHWRLLGISPAASAEDVRAAFARRVQDVHPDTGGTGDGLTMRLLVDARDEALAHLGDRGAPRRAGSRSGQDTASRAPSTHGRAHPDPKLSGYPCSACGRHVPHDQLKHDLAGRAFWRRKSSMMVLLCPPCHAKAEERHKNARFLFRATSIAALVLVALWLW